MLLRLGLHYCHPKVKVIKMLYHSLHPFGDDFLRQELQQGKREYKDNFIVGYGVLAPGIHGTETVLSPSQLEKDLQLAKDTGVKEVIIFRLGGLNEKYVKVLKRFV